MLVHWIWLATRPNMNDRQKIAVLERFQDPEDAYYAQKEAYRKIEGLTQEAAEALEDKDLHTAANILHQCTDADIHICAYSDSNYPASLRNISDPPLVLYYKGRLPDFDGSPVISVIGTREASAYGMNVANRMGSQIARCGGIVVSGLAAGNDAASVAGALSAGAPAVGILGFGVDVVYPVCNRALFADVQRYGCLISEFPPETPPYKWNFPKRNRLIGGIANGVLIVEAPKKSGALITARLAAEQGRDVFVVPGNVDVPTCAGSNALLREGAMAVSRGWDVISEYVHLYPDKIRRDDRPVQPAGFTDEVMSSVRKKEKRDLKVAQKPRSPAKIPAFDRKNVKKTIDNGKKPPYSDIRDPLEGLNDTERMIAGILQQGEMLVDDVIAQTGLPAGTVLSTLTVLEVKGVVARKPGNRAELK